jgi:acetyl esterase/lipase
MPRSVPRRGHLVSILCTLVLTGCGEIQQLTDLSYDDRHAATRLDVYLPAARATDPIAGRPGVLLVHGGGWRSLGRDVNAADAMRLAELGYVAINIDYRLVPSGTYPAAVADVLCALAFSRAHAAEWGLDPGRLAAWGYSAGGHLVSLAGVATAEPAHQPDCASGPAAAPAAVIAGAGPQDLATLPQVTAVTEFVGGTLAEVPDRYALASPLHHVAAGAPPFLFVHGDADWFVSIDQAERMRTALRAVGTSAELVRVPGGGHIANLGSGDRWDYVIASVDTPAAWLATTDFLARTVGAP